MPLLNRLSPNNRELLPLYGVFVALIIAYCFLDSTFVSISSWSTLSIQFMPLIAASMAQTIVMLTGGIDLSVGASISLMTAILSMTMTNSAIGVTESIIITLVSGVVIGVVHGLLVTFGRLPAIIVTLATSYLWQGIALFILPQPGGHVAGGFTNWMNATSLLPAGVIMIIIAIVAWKFVKTTPLGTAIYATGDNTHGAYVSGIKTNRVKVMSYALAGVFMALAGIALVGQTGSGDPNIGTPYTLNSIASAVLGGISFFGGQGQVKGTVIGAIIIGSLMNILFFTGISPFFQYVVQGLILVIAVGFKAVAHYRRDSVV